MISCLNSRKKIEKKMEHQRQIVLPAHNIDTHTHTRALYKRLYSAKENYYEDITRGEEDITRTLRLFTNTHTRPNKNTFTNRQTLPEDRWLGQCRIDRHTDRHRQIRTQTQKQTDTQTKVQTQTQTQTQTHTQTHIQTLRHW